MKKCIYSNYYEFSENVNDICSVWWHCGVFIYVTVKVVYWELQQNQWLCTIADFAVRRPTLILLTFAGNAEHNLKHALLKVINILSDCDRNRYSADFSVVRGVYIYFFLDKTYQSIFYSQNVNKCLFSQISVLQTKYEKWIHASKNKRAMYQKNIMLAQNSYTSKLF